jgi:alpha-1,2-mannosyltransferase
LFASSCGSSLAWAIFGMQGRLQDLGSFLHSGASYAAGLDPYADNTPWIKPPPISHEALNLNPPISVYVFDFLAKLNPTLVQVSFVAGSALLFALTVWLLTNAYPDKKNLITLLAICSLAGLGHLLAYQQIYAPLILAVALSWLAMRRGNLLAAGLLIGFVVAVKPNFALWPALLLAAGHPRVAIVATATTACISAVPLLIDGPHIYVEWLHLTSSFGGLQWASDASLVSLGDRLGSVEAGTALAVATAALIFLWALRFKPGLHDATALALITVLLVGPVSWAGYTLVLLPVLLSRRWTRATWIAVVALTVPFWLIRDIATLSIWPSAVLGSLYGWAILVLLFDVLAGLGLENQARDLFWFWQPSLSHTLRQQRRHWQPGRRPWLATPRARRFLESLARDSLDPAVPVTMVSGVESTPGATADAV